VWGEHKSAEQIARIVKELGDADELALVTRVSPEKADSVRQALTELGAADHPLRYDAVSRCLLSPELPLADPSLGTVAVLGGGSSDLAVAAEARLALACHAIRCELVLDVGVAGLHRLLDRIEELRSARALIVCAGMEGSLPTVVAGLLPQPVIGVPVAVGYGVSEGGVAALHGMLASCSPGLTVVNIGNGYGAAMAALRILRASAPEPQNS
jgi:hypothetical protein